MNTYKYPEVELLCIDGVDQSLYGLGLSYGITSDISYAQFLNYCNDIDERNNSNNDKNLYYRMVKVASSLFAIGHGHDKFMRMIQFWVKIKAPTYWWLQFDTYKVGTVSQSESKMHTILRNPFTPEMFDVPPYHITLTRLNVRREAGNIEDLVPLIPQGFLQTRVVNMNLAVLCEMIYQRRNHKLGLWRKFIDDMINEISQFNYYFPPEWVGKLNDIAYVTDKD